MASKVNEKDILVMKLINYFMVKKNYIPIIIRGVDNEVWLENPRGEYRIIRIVTKNIFNNEQYEFDTFKTKNIVSQIMKKTFNPFIDVLTIYTEIGDNFKKKIENTKRFKYVTIEKESDIEKCEILNKSYKDLKENLAFEEEGIELLTKITSNISEKNLKENERYEVMYKQKKPIVTYIMIAINVIVFALMYVFGKGSEDTQTLIDFGAVSKSLVDAGGYWRIIASAFLHIGILHLLCNMYSLYVLGPTIEHFFGKIKYLIIYFYSAIMGSIFAILFQGANTISAGASGAIFGLLGALLYFGISYRGYVGNRIVNQVLSVIALNLVIGFSSSGISNAAHIGGLLGGIACSFMLGVNMKEETKSRRINGTIITVIFTAFMIYLTFFK